MNVNINAKRMTLIAATVLAAFAGGARADDITPDPYTHMAASTRSRAEVVAELRAARSSGQMAQAHGEDSGSFQLARQAWVPGKTRAEVRAEVLAARGRGELSAMSGEDSGSFHLARLLAVPDAARVVAVLR
jgi:hypothetical protein